LPHVLRWTRADDVQVFDMTEHHALAGQPRRRVERNLGGTNLPEPC
jgi:hypothetical protein